MTDEEIRESNCIKGAIRMFKLGVKKGYITKDNFKWWTDQINEMWGVNLKYE